MNKRESKHRGDTMKRLIALSVAVVFCVTLFSPTITASQWDPKRPHLPLDQNSLTMGSGDDTPWADEQSSICSNGHDVWFFCSGMWLSSSSIFFFGLIMVPAFEAGGDDTGNNETDDTGTTLEDGGPSSR